MKLGMNVAHRLPELEATVNGRGRYPKVFCPCTHGLNATAELNSPRLPRIETLFLRRSPNAVLWAVVAIAVFSFNAVLAGVARSHVGNEVLVGQPSIAYPYPTAAVVLVVAGRFVCASSNHAAPNTEFRYVCQSVLGSRIELKAPARSAMPTGQCASRNFDYAAAITTAFPSSFVVALPIDKLKNEKASECLAKEVFPPSPASARGCLSSCEVVCLHNALGSACAATEPCGSTVDRPVVLDNKQSAKLPANQVFGVEVLGSRILLNHDALLNRVLWPEPLGVSAPMRLAHSKDAGLSRLSGHFDSWTVVFRRSVYLAGHAADRAGHPPACVIIVTRKTAKIPAPELPQ